eukprot:g2699.t1
MARRRVASARGQPAALLSLLLVAVLLERCGGARGRVYRSNTMLRRASARVRQHVAKTSAQSTSANSLLRARSTVLHAAAALDCSGTVGPSSVGIDGREGDSPCDDSRARLTMTAVHALEGKARTYALQDKDLLSGKLGGSLPTHHEDGIGGSLRDEMPADETIKLIAEESRKENKHKREEEEKAKARVEQMAKAEEERKNKERRKKEQETKKKKEEEEKRKAEEERKRVAEELAKQCRPLPGHGTVIDGSSLVKTSQDLRGEIVPGDGVRIGGRDYLVRDPQDAVTFTVDRPWSGGETSAATSRYRRHENSTHNKTVTTTTITTTRVDTAVITSESLPMCKIMPKNRIHGCKKLSCTGSVLKGSMTIRTACDLRSEIVPGETMYVNSEVSCVIAMEGVYSDQVLTCEKAWALASASAVNLCKRRNGFTGFGHTPGLFKLSGELATERHSELVMTTEDLRFEISPGDAIRIRTEQFRVRSPVLSRSFAVDHPSALPSEEGLTGYKISPCFALPGTVALTKGSRTVTTSDDLRPEVSVGDVVELDGFQFEVIDVPDAFTMMLSRAWSIGGRDGMTVMKCPVAAQSGTQLSGTCSAKEGSAIVLTSEDLTSEISASDLITIGAGGRTYVLVEPMSAGSLTLESPFEGPSMEGRCWREPQSERERVLEQLALKKLQCQTIYCLAKIEEQERQLSFGIPRSLSASDMVNGLESALMVHGNEDREAEKNDGDFDTWMKDGEKLDNGPTASVNKAMLGP